MYNIFFFVGLDFYASKIYQKSIFNMNKIEFLVENTKKLILEGDVAKSKYTKNYNTKKKCYCK